MAAMRHESACHARYGRPTSIVLLELRGPVDTVTIDEAARALAEVIRSESRETDRAVRLEALAFRVLLRETGGRAASKLADRLARAFVATLDQIPGIELRVELAAPQRTETVEDALAAAESRLAEGTRPD
jgi:GGDEF domain-containing protein